MPRVVFVLLVVTMLFSSGKQACAQAVWASAPIIGHDLSVTPLQLDELWSGGYLRVMIMAPDALPPSWKLRLQYGAGQVLDLDESTISGRIVGERHDDRITLDLPVIPRETVTATLSPSSLRLAVIEILYPSRINSQQMIGPNWKIDLFDTEVKKNEQEMGPGFGRLDLLTDDGRLIAACTAFRVARQYWMTAGHCVAKIDYQPDIGKWRLLPLEYAADYHKGPVGPVWTAFPAATGQGDGKPNPSVPLKTDELDYALLNVPDDPGGPTFSLDNAVVLQPDEPLQLFQHWPGKFGPAAGKARSADAECIVRKHQGPIDDSRAELCTKIMRHGCSSEPSSSGGPLVARDSLRLVAIHLRAGILGSYNCGLPAAKVVSHICQKNPDIAKGVTKCR